MKNIQIYIKLYKYKILFFLVIFFLGSCEYNKKEDLINRSNSTSKLINIQKEFHHNGTLKRIARFSNKQLIGFVKYYDSLGRIRRLERYGWRNKLTKNYMVEWIAYDTIGNVNLSKSMFLKTIPNALDDTIYYSIKDNNSLNLKWKFITSTRKSACRVIIKSNDKIDTINTKSNKWKNYLIDDLKPGIKNLYFYIEAGMKKGAKSIHESRRVFKISK